jgi:competence protein ComEC
MMALSFCIQLALLPVLTHHFSTVSLIAIFSNVILIPLASLILYSSVIGLAVSLFPPVATLYFYILEWEVSLLNMVAKLFAQTPYATIVLPKMNVAEAALYYIVLFAIFGYYNLKKRTTRMTLVVGVAICILASAAIRLSGVSF